MSIATRLASGNRATEVTRRSTGRKIATPAAGTLSPIYSTPGQPQANLVDGDVAMRMGYYGHLYSARCAMKIAQTIAALPYRAGADPSKPDRWNANAPLAQLLGPRPGGPAPGITSRALWRWSFIHFAMTGRYAWETVPYVGSPETVGALYPLPSMYLKPIEAPPKSPHPWSGFIYQTPRDKRPLRVNQVHYGWRPSLEDWRKPESYLTTAKLSLEVSEAMDVYMRAFMRNNMALTTLIVTPPFANDDLRNQFQDQFVAMYAGTHNAGSTLFTEVSGGGEKQQQSVQVEKIGASARDSQLMDIRNAVRDEICDHWGVPRSVFGQATERTYENADQETRNYWTGTVLEWIAEYQDSINTSLAPRLGDEVGWFDLSEVAALKPPMRFQPEPGSALAAAGIIDDNEVREEYGYAPRGAPTAELETPVPEEDDTPGGGPPINPGAGLGGRHTLEALTYRCLVDLDELDAGLRYDTSPTGHGGDNWVTRMGGLPLFVRAVVHAMLRAGRPRNRAYADAIEAMKRWAAGLPAGGEKGKPTPKTQAKAAAALAELKAKGAASKALTASRREAVMESGGSSGAALLLPVGTIRTSNKPPHRFVAQDANPQRCTMCGLHRTSRVHKKTAERAEEPEGERHRGKAGHLPVPGGHAKGRASRRLAHSRVIDRATRATEGQLEATLHDLFGKQAKSTISRLQGNRGRQMLRDSAQPVEQPEPPIDPARVFDSAYWTAQTAQRLQGVFGSIAALIPGHVGALINLPAGLDESRGVGAVQDLLSGRANQIAGQVTNQTYKEITDALNQGVAQGDGISALTKRVQDVFDLADRTRAERIARTEVQGAVNGSQLVYAAGLPNADQLEKEWLATPDERTRETHHAANGQRVPLGQPFDLGPEHAKLQYPGDPTGPPGEVINCRCTPLIVPMNEPED